MITLSSSAIEAMGFRRFGPDHAVRATFKSAFVYQAQGLQLDLGTVSSLTGSIQNVSYGAALGSDLNQVAETLSANNYTDDDIGVWERERNSKPPYLIVVIGPTKLHECSEGYIREDSDTLITYDCFPRARSELSALDDRVIPPLLAGLAATFGLRQPPVKFVKSDRTWFGVTEDRRVLHDIRIGGSATAYVSARVSADDATAMLSQAGALAERLNKKVARFSHLALEEADPLKRFLYFFLSIEIGTHATFKTIDQTAHLGLILASPARLQTSLPRLLVSQPARWTALYDRFVWCALCVWTHLDDTDVAAFSDLKKIRDKIAHGTISVPPADTVLTIQRLATRVQSGTR